jgi:hypothetical protein
MTREIIAKAATLFRWDRSAPAPELNTVQSGPVPTGEPADAQPDEFLRAG